MGGRRPGVFARRQAVDHGGRLRGEERARSGREAVGGGSAGLGGQPGEVAVDQGGERLPLLVLSVQGAQPHAGLAAGLLAGRDLLEHLLERLAVVELLFEQQRALAQQGELLLRVLGQLAAVLVQPVELTPALVERERFFEVLGAGARVGIDAERASQVADRAVAVFGLQARAAELDEQLAGAALLLGVAHERRGGVDVGERLERLVRVGGEPRGGLEVRGRLGRVAAPGDDAAELELEPGAAVA